VFGVPPNTSICFARLGKPKQCYARAFQKKIVYVLHENFGMLPGFKGIQAYSRPFKPLPRGYMKK
jgi:hypothetical protein